MEIVNEIINVLNWLATNIPWEAILASGVLTAFLQIPKQWVKKWFEHYDWVMLLLAGIGSLAIVTIDYLTNDPSFAPKFLPVYAAAMAYATQPFYKVMLKPLISWLSAQAAQAAIQLEAQSATEPATGLPITASPVEQFSE